MNERSLRIQRRFAFPVLVAALLVIPVIVIEESSFGEPWDTIGVVLNWTTWLVLVSETAAMLAVVPDRRRWLRAHPVEVGVAVLTPPFLPALAPLRLLRALPVLRRERFARFTQLLFTIEGLRYVVLLAAVTAVGGGAVFAALEGKSNADGIYWALTTMTTVGYGDLSPETNAGKALAVLVMLVGTGAVAILTGAVAQQFIVTELEEESTDAEAEKDKETTAILDELGELQTRLATIQASMQRRSQP